VAGVAAGGQEGAEIGVMRFLHSHSAHESFDRCRAQFALQQSGAPRSREANNFLFGRTFHKFAQLYRDHCIAARRWSDVEAVSEIVDAAFRTTGLSTGHYEAMTLLCRQFVANERIDIDRSLMREGGIALDENLRMLPWSDEFEYDSPNFRASGSRAAIRMQLDEVLVDPLSSLLIIDDWKTDYYVPSESEIDDPAGRWWKQAHEYAWGALRYLFPRAIAVEFRFKFVRWNVTRTVVMSPEELNEYGEMFVRRVRFIESTEDFVATPGDHCSFCPYLYAGCPIADRTARYRTPIEAIAADYIRDEAVREERRDVLKQYAAADGTIMVGGLPVAIFDKTESRVLDVAKALEAMHAEGIVGAEFMLDVSPSKLKNVLDADQFERVMRAATKTVEGKVVFNVHQNKSELVALAESLGIPEPKKLKVAALARAIAQATSQRAA
jgi:hypothetical protein